MSKALGRDDWIRTSGLFVPNEARYLAALHPEKMIVFKVRVNTSFLFSIQAHLHLPRFLFRIHNLLQAAKVYDSSLNLHSLHYAF